jgi:hypothetical protein
MENVRRLDSSRNLFLRGDPLTRLFLERFRLNTWSASLLILVVLPLPIYVAGSIGNLWLTQPGRMIGLLEDYGWWWRQFVSFPATVFFFFWAPKGIQNVIEGLRENEVIVAPKSQSRDDALTDFMKRFAQSYNHRAWASISLILVTTWMVLYIPAERAYMLWHNSGEFIFWYTQLVHLSILSMAVLLAIRGIVVALWFNRLFREFKVDVRALHPDKAGGLLPLGRFVGKIGWLIGIYGFTAVVLFLEAPYKQTMQFNLILEPVIGILGLAYVLFAPSIFFSMLGTAHSAMKETQSDFMLQVSNQFDQDIASVQAVLQSDADEFQKTVIKLEQLQKIHAMAASFPVWPFDARIGIRFFTAYLAPIIVSLTLGVLTKLAGL